MRPRTLDEIHRFNRSQQDALLPSVEDGTIRLVGATTENPYVLINKAPLSRCVVEAAALLADGDMIGVDQVAEACDRSKPVAQFSSACTGQHRSRSRRVRTCRGVRRVAG